MNNQEKIDKLEEFNLNINRYFNGEYEDSSKLKTIINYDVPIVQDLVIKADCLKRMTVAPPSAVGGIIMKDINPFDMIFQNAWGRSFIPDIKDMVEQAIGKYKNNLVEDINPISNDKSKQSFNKDYPHKITMSWLFNHVPVKLWFLGLGLLGTTFWLGVKFAPLFTK